MLFDLANITKSYGPVIALQDLTVAMPEGAIGLLGPNGAGKTTMIRTLLGLIRINAGGGKVLGMDIRRQRLDIRQVVGFVPEDECLFPGVGGVGFVAFAGRLCGMGGSDALQRAHEVLDYVGLGEARYRPVESYSTGMKQRLKLAAAIVHDPRLLILDEPTNGMDPAGREEILKLAQDLARNKGMSLLFSSHLLPDVEAVCDHVMVLGRGRLLTQGKLDDLKQGAAGRYLVRLKDDHERFSALLAQRGIAATPQGEELLVTMPETQPANLLWSLAHENGLQIRLLRPQRSTLEDVFLRAVRD
ncbi:MAG TPA: ABC transporter ATP-binding protein [Gemmatales bacterium]|nr:ABC transporter ATP-binding protein [Gemmatales bacterium]